MAILSRKEKQEMLEDARSLKRRDAFRKAQPLTAEAPSFDAYLKFLNGVHKVFSQVSATSVSSSKAKFKL